MRSTISLLVILWVIVFSGCSSNGHGSGELAGHVDIGPLQPVARVGEPEPTPPPELYAAWQIVVLTKNGNKEIARAIINSLGDYQVQLSAGSYMVTSKPTNGGGFGTQQIYPVEIYMGKVTRLDLKIDTGIR